MLHNAKENKGEGKEGTHRSTHKLTKRETEHKSKRKREREYKYWDDGERGCHILTWYISRFGNFTRQ